ncbi:MAG: hypothetical protein K1X71_18055 [Pirellulales bacterium]|nr:hypothetical protein [Pirellulales bacterium]
MANSKRDRKPREAPPTPESRAADFVTVGWLLSALTALICNVISVLSSVAVRGWPDVAGLQVFAGLTQFAALVVGAIALALLAVVRTTRVQSPPPGLVALTIVIALLAPALFFVRFAGWL